MSWSFLGFIVCIGGENSIIPPDSILRCCFGRASKCWELAIFLCRLEGHE